MNVYLVTSGSYSSYHVEAVFSTREKADDYVKAATTAWTDFNDVEEFPVDSAIPPKTHRTFHARIRLDDGTIEEENEYIEEIGKEYLGTSPISPRYGEPPYALSVASVVSAEHARKLAAEARQAYVRQKTAEEDAARLLREKSHAAFKAYVESGGH